MRGPRRSTIAIAAIIATQFLLSVAKAQSIAASVTGVVSDQTGAVIPGAGILARNVETGVVARTASNQAGVYLLPSLVPGKYTLRVTKDGFKAFNYEAFDLDVRAEAKLDVHLELGGTSESVQVTAESTQLSLSSASIGSVIQGKQVLDLPLQARSALDLLSTVGGAAGGDNSNINGNRSGATNLTLDGIFMGYNLTDGLTAATSVNGFSVDRVEEIRIITAPADAELGHGSAQIQMVSRGGTNTFHGSLFEENRNTDLAANNWFNNQQGYNQITKQQVAPRPVLIRNQFGGRLGGPIIKNKTFFNFTYEGNRQVSAVPINDIVYTASAREGIFRFYPGTVNANAASTVRPPTVDANGNPVQPATATGGLVSMNLFNVDPSRVPDPTGYIGKTLAASPLPNNFLVGDGLNTAGYTWNRPTRNDVNRYIFRFDHQLTQNTRAAFNFSKEWNTTVNPPNKFPTELPLSTNPYSSAVYNLSLTTVVRPNLINEVLIGANRPHAPADSALGPYTDPLQNFNQYYPQAPTGGHYVLGFGATNGVAVPNLVTGPPQSDGSFSTYQFGDALTWLKGSHTFKGGGQFLQVGHHGWNMLGAIPVVTTGTGSVAPSSAITAYPGIGSNSAPAAALLADLAGNVASITESLYSVGGSPYLPYVERYRKYRAPQSNGFFKDDWKVTPNLTLNLGVRYEVYFPFHEGTGNGLVLNGTPFGTSGNTYSALFQPGISQGSTVTPYLTKGPLYNGDYNNFAPAVGLTYALPWFGAGKTVFRAGYSWGYEPTPTGLFTNYISANPGLTSAVTITPSTLTNLAGITVPVAPTSQVLTPPPANHSQVNAFFSPNLRVPYIQNWNVSLAHALPGGWSLDVRYIGSKGTRLLRTEDLNEVNIYENGILNAFQITQAGGNAPLFNQIFNGLTVPGLSGTVDGTNVTGSQLVRANTTTQTFLANNNVPGFANYLNTSTQFTGVIGGLLPRAGLPLNFITVNPQASNSNYLTNNSSSTYNALQVEANHRFASGFLTQNDFTWSKAISDGDVAAGSFAAPYQTIRNLGLNKAVLSFDHEFALKSNGVWELPFGNGKAFLSHGSRLVNRIVGGWQVGAILTILSGPPLGFTGANTVNLNNANGGLVVPVASLNGLAAVDKVGSGVTYFGTLHQVADPSIANITTANNIRGQSTLFAMANSSGQIVLENPLPGQLGGLGFGSLRGPGLFNLDLNLIKRIQLTEKVLLQLQADALSATNTPQFGAPNTSIDSPSFGTITTATGSRVVVLKARITF